MNRLEEQSLPSDGSPTPAPIYHETGVLKEIWAFLRIRKKFWLAPIIIALVFLGLLMWLSGSAGVLSPFIYAL